MTTRRRFTEEFKEEAANQVIVAGHSVADVAARLGVSGKSLYNWVRKYEKPKEQRVSEDDTQSELRRLRAELKRVTQERDILKKANGVLRKRVRVRYTFIRTNQNDFPLSLLCKTMKVNRSGYYAWLKQPLSKKAKEDQRLTGLIKQFWLESGCVYGYRKIHSDLREVGEHVGKNRVARLARVEGIKAQVGYRKRPGSSSGAVAEAAPNHLNREFSVETPDMVWVTDITYIRTHEGWLYLAVVIDLYSRQVVGWSMDSRMEASLVLNALLMAVWRRKPVNRVLIHSDQGSQFTSSDWVNFLDVHNLKQSMSRRGNCYDNAVAESFFQLLKRERVRRRIYATRADARRDVFDYIEMFYNSTRKHGNNGMLSPKDYEEQQKVKLGVV
ncbi:IS3 family transposase [Alkalimarinus coralli]|uniref:IS3 family transposase n=1 Tax=Alkalimarinus coralli TaxID=2935863 RepID=UPI00202AC46D|nr:IS3 family transposase [Alkalimarinus coralli]